MDEKTEVSVPPTNPFAHVKLAVIGQPTHGAKLLGPPKPKPKAPDAKRARMLDLTQRLLHSKGEAVVVKIIEVALDDKHPGQMQALKLCLDRIAPQSFFDDKNTGDGKTIEIKVSITDPRSTPEPRVIDGEAEVVDG